MPSSSYSTTSSTSHSSTPGLMFAGASLMGAAAIGLLIGGSVSGHVSMLAWGVLAGIACVGLACLLVVRTLIDDAVRRCVASVAVVTDGAVNHTAVQVGGAIADALSAAEAQDDRDREHVGVPRIYSGRS